MVECANMFKDNIDFIYSFQVDPDPSVSLDPKISAAIGSLWKDPAVPSVLEHQSEFYIMDSAP